jgi:hypothetical protein
MDLDLPTIRQIAEKLQEEQRRIRIELEPEIDGKFETTIMDLVEGSPSIQRSDASILFGHDAAMDRFDAREEVEAALNGFIDTLQKLPRLTREFFGWIIDNSDKAMGVGRGEPRTNADYVERKRRDKDGMNSDFRLLEGWRFLSFEQDEPHKSGWFDFYFPGSGTSKLGDALTDYLIQEGLSAATMFSTMNFTALGPAPKSTSSSAVKKEKPK